MSRILAFRLLLVLTAAVGAAWLLVGTTVAADGVASKPVPHLPDGHPDLNGTWDNGSGIDFVNPQHSADGSVCIAGCAPAAPANAKPADLASKPPAPRAAVVPNTPQYRPEFLAKVHDLDKRQVKTDPVLRCKSPGVPRIGPPDKIVQTRNQVVFLYDDVSGGFFRIVPTDGRPHRTDIDDSYLGDAVGHWEGETLVVESNHFNDETWLTDNGAFHTTGLRVTETLHRVGDTIEYQATVEDPKVLLEPWKPRPRILKLTDVELAEPAPCTDQDLGHLVDDSHHANPR